MEKFSRISFCDHRALLAGGAAISNDRLGDQRHAADDSHSNHHHGDHQLDQADHAVLFIEHL